MAKDNIKPKIIKYLAYYGGLATLTFIRALGTYIFIVPNGFAPGGISGLASIIYNAVLPFNPQIANTWLNAGITVFYMNIPLLIIAYFKLNKVFVLNTSLCVALYAFFMWILGVAKVPVFQSSDMESGFMLVAALAGGVMIGISMGIMLLSNMSMGGTDIVGKVMYEKNPVVNAQWFIFLSDIIVVIAFGRSPGLSAAEMSTPTPLCEGDVAHLLFVYRPLCINKGCRCNRHRPRSPASYSISLPKRHKEIADAIVSRLRGRNISPRRGRIHQRAARYSHLRRTPQAACHPQKAN